MNRKLRVWAKIALTGLVATAAVALPALPAFALDDELSISDVAVLEGDNGTVDAVFTVTRANPSATDPVTVDCDTGGGTATEGIDYVTGDALTCASFTGGATGSTSETITITVTPDQDDEINETFVVTLSGGNGNIVGPTGTGTIVDDDGCIADFDSDGDCDLVLGSPLENVDGADDGGEVNVLLSDADSVSAAGDQRFHQNDSGDTDDGVPAGALDDPAEKSDQYGKTLAIGDFDGDGNADLAAGVPFEDVAAGKTNDGAVNVLYGAAAGLDPDTTPANEQWSQDGNGTDDISLAPGNEDRFGSALAVGDFNLDGFSDLAIGVPYEDIGATSNAGAVNVLYGSATGLEAAGNQILHQAQTIGSDTTEDSRTSSDLFATTLSSADYNGDGYADLAVGVPYEDEGAATNTGGVHVFYGTAAGFTAADDEMLFQSNTVGVNESDDRFGWSLASGNFDGDGFADLAVGHAYEDVVIAGPTTISNAGAVSTIEGASAGLGASTNTDAFTQTEATAESGGPETSDYFGWAVAVGDFDGDGYDEVAIGAPYENRTPAATSITDAGVVHVLAGAAGGVTAAGNELWEQGTSGDAVADQAESTDRFGQVLAVGDFGSDGISDLAVGAPLENIGSIADAGLVQVFYGVDTSGLSSASDELWFQNTAGVKGVSETSDQLGSAIAA